MRRLPLLLLPLLAGCAATARDDTYVVGRSPGHEAQSGAEVIGARQAMMHLAATLLFQNAMQAAKNGTDVRAQEDAADGLARFGHSLPGLFPPGSDGPFSRALPSVWSDKADFDAKANAFGESAARLAQLAKAGDTAGFAALAPTLARGCGGCHSLYRAK